MSSAVQPQDESGVPMGPSQRLFVTTTWDACLAVVHCQSSLTSHNGVVVVCVCERTEIKRCEENTDPCATTGSGSEAIRKTNKNAGLR